MEVQPNSTLYINNLNDKLKVEPTKKILYMLFSQYGKVKSIKVSKGRKLRGQAWITFDDTFSATSALRGKQGFNVYGKELRIQYATIRTASDQKVDKRKRVQTALLDADSDAEEGDESDLHHRVRAKTAEAIASSIPNRILFVQNLPQEFTQQSLSLIFAQCLGLIEVRIAPGNRGVAFIEFENEIQAGLALKQLNGFHVTPTNDMRLAYAANI